MLYQLRPDGSMHWIELPSELALGAAREHGADLGLLDWTPSEWSARELEIGLALRHGVACRGGIVVAGSLIAMIERPQVLREAIEQEITLIEQLLAEPLDPGLVEHWRRLGGSVPDVR